MNSLTTITASGSEALPTGQTLAQVAAAEYERRRQRARRKVAQNEIDPHAADRLLRPWLALACRAGADLPEFQEQLAELLIIPADVGKLFFNDSQARAVVADDICPLAAVRSALAAARDSAIDKAAAAQGLDLERNERAAGLVALAIAHGAPAYRHPPVKSTAPQGAKQSEVA